MPSLVDSYYERAGELLARARQANAAAITNLGPLIGASVARGGVVHTFGSGHSDCIAREIIGRAGGLACVSGIIDPTNGFIENLPGYGAQLVARHDRQYQLLPGEIIIVISNSGKNASPIDVALYAKAKGLVVVSLSCLAMSRAVASQHASGKKLHEVADHVLDNGGVSGDAIVDLGDGVCTGPTSTLIGCSVLNWLMLSAIAWLQANGHPVPLLRSQNTPGAIEHNREVGARYRARLSRQLA